MKENEPKQESLNQESILIPIPLEQKTKKGPRIVLIDDDPQWPKIISDELIENGYRTIGFRINPSKHPTRDGYRQIIQQIIENKADVVVSDKGIGKWSGIELINLLKEHNIFTIMLTGEHETRETHRVAHVYVEKFYLDDVYPDEIILEALKTYFPTQNF